MARLLSVPEVQNLEDVDDDVATAAALGVDVERVRRTVVHLLWDDLTVGEAVATAAALRATGSADEADAVLRAVLDQCVGLGSVPLGGQRRPGDDGF